MLLNVNRDVSSVYTIDTSQLFLPFNAIKKHTSKPFVLEVLCSL